jgi:hypothetical protein
MKPYLTGWQLHRGELLQRWSVNPLQDTWWTVSRPCTTKQHESCCFDNLDAQTSLNQGDSCAANSNRDSEGPREA